jgi:hypothetical protein
LLTRRWPRPLPQRCGTWLRSGCYCGCCCCCYVCVSECVECSCPSLLACPDAGACCQCLTAHCHCLALSECVVVTVVCVCEVLVSIGCWLPLPRHVEPGMSQCRSLPLHSPWPLRHGWQRRWRFRGRVGYLVPVTLLRQWRPTHQGPSPFQWRSGSPCSFGRFVTAPPCCGGSCLAFRQRRLVGRFGAPRPVLALQRDVWPWGSR